MRLMAGTTCASGRTIVIFNLISVIKIWLHWVFLNCQSNFRIVECWNATQNSGTFKPLMLIIKSL